MDENIGEGIVFAALFSPSLLPTSPSERRSSDHSPILKHQIWWEITTLFQTAAGMFLKPPQGQDRLHIASIFITMATNGLFHHEVGENVTDFWFSEEWSDGLFTTEEEEKENKSRKSRWNKSLEASAAVISHSYVTQERFLWEQQCSSREERGCPVR